jgi:hypothetical protein
VTVAEELSRRYPVSQWQFTLSATQADRLLERLLAIPGANDVAPLAALLRRPA